MIPKKLKIFFFFFLLVGCQSLSLEDPAKMPWSNDKAALLQRFPFLLNFEKCFWKSGKLGKNSFLSVGPSDYWVAGYLFLKKDDFEKIRKSYTWEPGYSKDFQWIPINQFHFSSDDWGENKDFNRSLIPSFYSGSFYLHNSEPVLYFRLTTQ